MPALGVGGLVWAVVYMSAGESKPAIWLVPTVALAAGSIALRRTAEPRRDHRAHA
ncbi:MAG: hypothetical protein ACRDQ2_02935 [Gaiellales bacterium]